MGKKWLIKKTKAEVEEDMWAIVNKFGSDTSEPKVVQGGHGRPKFNFEFDYGENKVDKSTIVFSGYGLINVTNFVNELGYNLDMWHFDTSTSYGGATLRLFLSIIEEEPSKFDTVEQEQAMKEVDSIFGSLVELRRRRWTTKELSAVLYKVVNIVLSEYKPESEPDISHGINLDENGFPIFEVKKE